MDEKRLISGRDCVHLANHVIVERNILIPRLTSIRDLDHKLFALLFERVFGIDCRRLASQSSRDEQISRMRALIETLSSDLIGVSLEHINAQLIIDRDLNSIYDLLEIITTFVKYIPKKFTSAEAVDNGKQEKPVKQSSIAIQTSFDSDRNGGHRSRRATRSARKTSRSMSSSSHSSDDHPIQFTPRTRASNQSKLDSPAKQLSVRPIDAMSSDARTVPNVTLERLKSVQTENFATELGYRLHEALQLKEMTKVIENKIKRYYGDVSATPRRARTKFTLKPTVGRKSSINTVKSPAIRRKTGLNRNLDKRVSPKMNINSLCLDDLVNNFPDIPRNTIRTLKLQEMRQKRIIDGLKRDAAINDCKLKSQLQSVIERQNTRSRMIRDDIRHLQTLAEATNMRSDQIEEKALKRETRMERARLKQSVDSFHDEMMSKLKAAQSKQESLVKKACDTRYKAQQQRIADIRSNARQKHRTQVEKQSKMLDALETLYQNKFELLTDNLNREERQLKTQLKDQKRQLRTLNTQTKSQTRSDFHNLFRH